MYVVYNFFIWIRKNIIRILLKEYPNKLLKSSAIDNSKPLRNTYFISSTDNFWVSSSMYKKWILFKETQGIDLHIYSNSEVNNFMEEYFKDDLIYEVFKRSIIPVQKMDIFRICIVYKFGGIWLDFKSEINLEKVLKLYKQSNSNGLLMYEPRKIEVISSHDNKKIKSFKNVIHNGFFFLPKESKFLENLLLKVKEDYLYFQDIVFSYPKQGIMNLTGPHQFTRTFHNIQYNNRPLLVSQKDIGWLFYSKYGEYISPFKGVKHYSSLRKFKTIDSKNYTILNEK